MSVLDNLRTLVLRRHLQVARKKKPHPPHRAPLQFDRVRRVGVLFIADNSQQRELVEGFIKRCRKERDWECTALARVASATEQVAFDYPIFTDKEINWAGVPKGNNVEQFVQLPFDLLFHLDMTPDATDQYLVALSDAHYKVGPLLHKGNLFLPGVDLYDLMIDPGPEATLDRLLRDAMTLLRKMTPHTTPSTHTVAPVG